MGLQGRAVGGAGCCCCRWQGDGRPGGWACWQGEQADSCLARLLPLAATPPQQVGRGGGPRSAAARPGGGHARAAERGGDAAGAHAGARSPCCVSCLLASQPASGRRAADVNCRTHTKVTRPAIHSPRLCVLCPPPLPARRRPRRACCGTRCTSCRWSCRRGRRRCRSCSAGTRRCASRGAARTVRLPLGSHERRGAKAAISRRRSPLLRVPQTAWPPRPATAALP